MSAPLLPQLLAAAEDRPSSAALLSQPAPPKQPLRLRRPGGDAGRRVERPFLGFLERRWSRAELIAEAGAAAGGLLRLGLAPGDRVGLVLPNLPALVTALLACWRAGLVPAPVDPRQAPAALATWGARLRPAALVTLDLATVYERALATAPVALGPLVVLRMADQLSLMKRLLAPWLRGGGGVTAVGERQQVAWRTLLTAAPPSGEGCTRLLLPDGWELEAADLLAAAAPLARGRWLLTRPLAEEPALAALLAAWLGEAELVLTPRLDERALLKVEKAARTTGRVPA